MSLTYPSQQKYRVFFFKTKILRNSPVIKSEGVELCSMNCVSFSCHQTNDILVENILFCLFRMTLGKFRFSVGNVLIGRHIRKVFHMISDCLGSSGVATFNFFFNFLIATQNSSVYCILVKTHTHTHERGSQELMVNVYSDKICVWISNNLHNIISSSVNAIFSVNSLKYPHTSAGLC